MTTFFLVGNNCQFTQYCKYFLNAPGRVSERAGWEWQATHQRGAHESLGTEGTAGWELHT